MLMLAFQPAGRSGARDGRAAQAHWGVERNEGDCRTEAQRGMGRHFHRLHVIPGQGNQYHWIANQDFPLDGENRSFQSVPATREGTVVQRAGVRHLGTDGPEEGEVI